MATKSNPFAIVRATDFTDDQINSLWVELGPKVIDTIMEPTSSISKFILGGKGTGKTHLLRYLSYPAVRLRAGSLSGLSAVKEHGYLAVFLRATALDAARFEGLGTNSRGWQQLFGIYLEIKLVEGLLDALADIKLSSKDKSRFRDDELINIIAQESTHLDAKNISSIEKLLDWLRAERIKIDEAINQSAFSGTLYINPPFSFGKLCLSFKRATAAWNSDLTTVPIIYLLDEIENFTAQQQEVVNSLLRYSEGQATFRVTGRLYGLRTLQTIGGTEENRDGAEFKKIYLDDILKKLPNKSKFAKNFVAKRIEANFPDKPKADPANYFEEFDSDNLFETALRRLDCNTTKYNSIHALSKALKASSHAISEEEIIAITNILSDGFPAVLSRLNAVLFCKKYSIRKRFTDIANEIRAYAIAYLTNRDATSYYGNALSHYKFDIFAQICRDSGKSVGVPYAGFDSFIQMSSGNPRNLLIILSRAYDIANFRDLDFLGETPLRIQYQTTAAVEAARFMFEHDTSYGGLCDLAKSAVERLAAFLRTARYSLNIPEASPLVVSFSDDLFSDQAKEVLKAALNFSLVFEIKRGRPDRNSQRVNRKIQLNPLLSPRWGLPIGRRGDLSLPSELATAIFEPNQAAEFDLILKSYDTRWNFPFSLQLKMLDQRELF